MRRSDQVQGPVAGLHEHGDNSSHSLNKTNNVLTR
jgi:hypothetical protein